MTAAIAKGAGCLAALVLLAAGAATEASYRSSAAARGLLESYGTSSLGAACPARRPAAALVSCPVGCYSVVPIGAAHSVSGIDDPAALKPADAAACIREAAGLRVQLRDVALANEVKWTDHWLRGTLDGDFQVLPDKKDAEPEEQKSDLLFLFLGAPGIYVFDVSDRRLEQTDYIEQSTLIGRRSFDGHSVFRLQVDPVRRLLLAGGFDRDGQAVIDLWDLARVNGAPGADPFALGPELTANALLSCESLAIGGGAIIDSAGLGSGAGGAGAGHVRSNAEITVSGAAQVRGNATAGPGQVVRLNGGGLVTGVVASAEQAVSCLPVDLAALMTALELAHDNASIPLTAKGKSALGGKAGRAFEILANDSITLPAGTFLFSSLKVGGNATVAVAGEARILCTGPVSFGGGALVNATGNPYHLRIWSSGTTVSLAGAAGVRAFLYAPLARVTITGGCPLTGGVFARAVEAGGGARVTRSIDDAPPLLEISEPLPGALLTSPVVEVAGRALDDEGAVALAINGIPVALAADGGFRTTLSLATPLIAAAATDLAGNVTRVEIVVVLDSSPPAVTIDQPALAAGACLDRRQAQRS
ncbi:MAG: hypothetical protein V1750_03680 [Acidobacteriota bacterium]